MTWSWLWSLERPWTNANFRCLTSLNILGARIISSIFYPDNKNLKACGMSLSSRSKPCDKEGFPRRNLCETRDVSLERNSAGRAVDQLAGCSSTSASFLSHTIWQLPLLLRCTKCEANEPAQPVSTATLLRLRSCPITFYRTGMGIAASTSFRLKIAEDCLRMHP